MVICIYIRNESLFFFKKKEYISRCIKLKSIGIFNQLIYNSCIDNKNWQVVIINLIISLINNLVFFVILWIYPCILVVY